MESVREWVSDDEIVTLKLHSQTKSSMDTQCRGRVMTRTLYKFGHREIERYFQNCGYANAALW